MARQRPLRLSTLILLATVAVFASAAGANAETFTLTAYLTGSAAVPPSPSDAFGEGRFTYDSKTRELDYFVTYDGLSSAKAEIHGPASPGQNAPVLIPFPAPESPISGTMILSGRQGAQLLAGKWYVEAHSQGYAPGRIRGQIEKQ